MKLPKFRITQGIIHINAIDVMHCDDKTLVFSLDCRQKYPELQIITAGCREFSIGATEETLHVNNNQASPTTIKVEWQDEDMKSCYHVLSSSGRYTIDIAIIKWDRVAQFIDDDNFTDGTI